MQSWCKRRVQPREEKKDKGTIYTEKKPKHFVELKLWNRKKNNKLKYHAYSISKLRNKINSKTKLKIWRVDGKNKNFAPRKVEETFLIRI